MSDSRNHTLQDNTDTRDFISADQIDSYFEPKSGSAGNVLSIATYIIIILLSLRGGAGYCCRRP